MKLNLTISELELIKNLIANDDISMSIKKLIDISEGNINWIFQISGRLSDQERLVETGVISREQGVLVRNQIRLDLLNSLEKNTQLVDQEDGDKIKTQELYKNTESKSNNEIYNAEKIIVNKGDINTQINNF